MENGVPPHSHNDSPIPQRNVIPDSTVVPVVPTWPAKEGTEVTYVNGPTIRRYKMIQGTWRYWTLT